MSFAPDGQTLASGDGYELEDGSYAGKVILWNFNLDDLIAKSCTWLRDYMTSTASEDEKALCTEELGLPLNSAVPSRVGWVANVRGFWRGGFGEG